MIIMKYRRDQSLAAYQLQCKNMPSPGKGLGCHRTLLRAANLGRMSEISRNQVFLDIRQSIPPGKRIVSDEEIMDAISKAFSNSDDSYDSIRKKDRNNGQTSLQTFLSNCISYGDEEIRESSPININLKPGNDAVSLISHLYDDEETLYIGNKYGKQVKKVKDIFKDSRSIPEYLIPNPLTGSLGLTKSGTPSYRCDACVANFRFAVAEFDSIPKEDQLKFWASVDLPISALIDSGNKSIHAWIRVDCLDREAWQREVKSRLYDDFLVPLGIDPSCCNPSRLSRLPGHFRQDTGQWQRLIYLCPAGRRVFPCAQD